MILLTHPTGGAAKSAEEFTGIRANGDWSTRFAVLELKYDLPKEKTPPHLLPISVLGV